MHVLKEQLIAIIGSITSSYEGAVDELCLKLTYPKVICRGVDCETCCPLAVSTTMASYEESYLSKIEQTHQCLTK